MIIIQCDKCDFRITFNQHLKYENGSVVIDIHNERDVKSIREAMTGSDYLNGKVMQFCKQHTEEMVEIKNRNDLIRRKELENWASDTTKKDESNPS